MLMSGSSETFAIRIFGPDLKGIHSKADEVEQALKGVADTRSVYAERVAQGYFTDIRIDRDAIAQESKVLRIVGDERQDRGVALVAGTGVGKSLAYLLPAALRAVSSNRRVVVSTATTTLQDQLFEQDLPLVRAGLADAAQSLRATVLKGRGRNERYREVGTDVIREGRTHQHGLWGWD